MKSTYPFSDVSSEQLITHLNAGTINSEFALLNKPKPGQPTTWMWTRSRRKPCIVKHAFGEDAEAIRKLDREYKALQILFPSGVVPEILKTLEDRNKLVGIITPYICPDDSVNHRSPEVTVAVAHAAAAAHARTWKISYPPFGLRVPVLFGGHALWIGADKIIHDSCENLRARDFSRAGDLLSDALNLIKSYRKTITAPFSPENMVLIHGDISTENIILTRRRGEAAAIFVDFGEAVVGPAQHDLARYAVSAELSTAETTLFLDSYIARFQEITGDCLETKVFLEGFETSKCLAIFDLKIFGLIMFMSTNSKTGDWITGVETSIRDIRYLLQKIN